MPLRGLCNQCGVCCLVTTPEGETLRCINLIVIGTLGEPLATHCGVYPVRTPDMPVYLMDQEGHLRGHTTCAADGSQDEFDNVVEKGIMTGKCSLVVAQ